MSITSYMDRNLSRWSGARVPSIWKRNPTWATLPSVSGLQKLAGLYAVFPESPFVAFTVYAAYTVDWGDGTTENFTSGATAYHQYSFSDADLANTDGPVTFQDNGDIVTRTNHGYADGDVVAFATITSTTGISANAPYYVISATANTFQLSTSSGGSAITLTTDGSGTLLAYKQAVIVITPQAANNLTSINLNVKHNQSGLNQYSSGWLDISVEGANLTSLTVSTSGTRNVEHRLLEQFSLTGNNGITSLGGAFYNCRSFSNLAALSATSCTNFSYMFVGCSLLESVPLFNTAAGTSFTNMFASCFSLVSVPLLNTASGTDFSSMFNNCFSLSSIPLLNTALGTNFSYMFYGCYSLSSIPLLNTASGTNFSYMFASCFSLVSVPLLNTAAGTTFTFMFNGCYSLYSIPLLNTASGTNFSRMFGSCSSLTSVPLLNTAAGTNFSYMFHGCYSLSSIPLLNTASGTNFSYMLSSCASLASVPLLNTALGTNFSSMFEYCTALVFVPLLNTAAGTNFASMFNGCNSLQWLPAINVGAATSASSYTSMFEACYGLERIDASGFKYTFSIGSCKLSAAALDALYTNLATVSGQTITVSSNWGTASDTPSIATNKGWTVTGS